MKELTRLISCLAVLGVARNIDERCKIDELSRITCRCVGKEEFVLPDGYNYENVTSLRIASCASANLHFSSLTEADRITEIIVQNISDRLIFELFLASKRIERLRLSKIRRIPLISRDTFLSVGRIESLRIEDARIDRFEEQFTDIAIREFSMINVTVEQADGWNFSEKGGGTLRIENSEFQKIAGSLNLGYFSNVEILRSKFHLQKPGHLLLEGDLVLVEECVFSNASVNLVAASKVAINGTCADGKSSMRLSADVLESANNRLPTEIVYTKKKRAAERFSIRNNTVCIAGNCKCPKTSGQGTRTATIFSYLPLQCSLPYFLLLTSMIF
ncbi:uncharacterized protein LOC116430013 [Nomia melanderi]|uniref:uncharacterized protein LOC116430013 n=1 Tax=Nomia melanderi TaxID=2448451 RepID=UPI0013046275|nr:uncharacterized protein LOC116430013 [Nomia melanderi]